MKDKLPEAFLARMKIQLDGEYSNFLESCGQKPEKGIRINTLKTTSEEILKKAPFGMEPVPWAENGFFVSAADDAASHPFYRAGLYYIQEPSAMAPAEMLPVKEGDKVLDMCAAPGGKACALAAKLNQSGLLVANDVNRNRCRALLHNLELTGAANIIVSNEKPNTLKKKFEGYFDKIIVDAPCSGEGMFRKNPDAVRMWSNKRVSEFSKLQKSILKSAVAMLKEGGFLMYSTCTFSVEENEENVDYILKNFPEMEVCPIEKHDGFSTGFFCSGFCRGVEKSVRLWPHRVRGEGHFFALMKKRPSAYEYTFTKNNSGVSAGKRHANRAGVLNNSFRESEKIIMREFLGALNVDINKSTLENKSGKVYIIPFEKSAADGINCMRCGLFAGELKKNRFVPSQALAFYLKDGDFKNRISFPAEDLRVKKYLEGESIEVDESMSHLMNGMVLIETEGFPLGFGRKNNQIIKSKYLWLK